MKARKRLIAVATAGAFFVGGAATATISDSAFTTVTPVELGNIVVDVDQQSGASTPVTIEPGVDGQVAVNTIPGSGAMTGTSGVVPGLEISSGVLKLFGDDFYLNGRELDFGPDRWMLTTMAGADLDGDGSKESWWKEIDGLIGRDITVLGDVDDDDIDVFQVNGVSMRPLDGPAPWFGGNSAGSGYEQDNDDVPLSSSTNINFDEAKRIALSQVPGAVIGAELDVDDDVVYWAIEVRSTTGSLFDIEINADTGRVIEVDRD